VTMNAGNAQKTVKEKEGVKDMGKKKSGKHYDGAEEGGGNSSGGKSDTRQTQKTESGIRNHEGEKEKR